MKKTMVRIVAALLVAMLALTLIPMGAFAAVSVDVSVVYYDKKNPTYEDYFNNEDYEPFKTVTGNNSVTIKTNDYDKHIVHYGQLLDRKGIIDFSKLNSEKDLEKEMSYVSSYKATADDYVSIAYAAHKHKLSNWYSDGTTHWRECLVCKKFAKEGFWDQFMYQNWCQDGDEDGICNVCGGDVPYHDITVIDSEGGKITLNRDNASHRTKITADVEVEAGYKLKKLHFVKVRDDGSKQEITRYKKNGQFWTLMPTYEMEVSAEFVKTKK